MSKILSYNKKTTGEGWIALTGQYAADEINMIDDPNGGLTKTPRTAIPSPFAQMDLVKNAFRRLAAHKDLHGELMDEKLVSNALDVAQLFFNYGELKEMLHIVCWNRSAQLERLKNEQEHQLLGETLEMFLEQDKEAFNFDRMDKLFFLVYGNRVVGSTSPVTLFMATPNAEEKQYPIPIEQNINCFDVWRPLHEREHRFVKYIFALFTAFPELKRRCSELNSYLITSFRMADETLKREILKECGNPEALDTESREKALTFLETDFEQMENGVETLGVPFFCIRQQDIRKAIAESDFRIEPSKNVADEYLPLVLQNQLVTGPGEQFRYVTAEWDDSITIGPDDYAPSPEKRILPATAHQYPWLTDDDFLQPCIIRLDYEMNKDCFFDGNITAGNRNAGNTDYALPLKPLFFKYFKAEDLWGTIEGKKTFELIHTRMGQTNCVKAILRIPVRKQGKCITLTRNYIETTPTDTEYDHVNNHGHIIAVPFALSITPFAKSPYPKLYNVQLVDRALGTLEYHSLCLSFHQDVNNQISTQKNVVSRKRSIKAEKRVGSDYYKVNGDFDYITLTLKSATGNVVSEAQICPKWPNKTEGYEAFTFAVDLGTTNTHVEFMQGDGMPEPLRIDRSARQKLAATLYQGKQALYDAIMKQEFIPSTIGTDYGFPQRTVLSESEHTDVLNTDMLLPLADANIPFIYEKESVGYGNRIVANLKWSVEPANNKRIRAYVTELAMLMRDKVLLGNGDLAKTRIAWFYPLSMKTGNVRKMEEMWQKTFRDVFGIEATSDNLIQMPESVAPYYYYKSSNTFRGAASGVAAIDIGGGSSDVVVFEPNAKQPTILTSFRFAANAVFGDGFSDVPHGDTNPMIRKYVGYFKRLFDTDDDKYGELSTILEDICSKRKSEDINAFLFSIANNKDLCNNDVFSYNRRLNEDSTRKVIFAYFYAAIIYYVAQTMKHHKLAMPGSVMFSGTGSKVLDIVGHHRDLEIITRSIFEEVYGQPYATGQFSIITEHYEPKQITCRGALMQLRRDNGLADINELNRIIDNPDSPLRTHYSMTGQDAITYADMEKPEIRQCVVEEVNKFNDFFMGICEKTHATDRLLIDRNALMIFKNMMDKDLEHHLLNGWNYMNHYHTELDKNEIVEDIVFFYPLIGIIRDNLIENLKEQQDD